MVSWKRMAAAWLALAGWSVPSESSAQGFPNVARSAGELIAGPIAPEQGRTAIVAWHGERIVSVPEAPGSQPGADLEIRVVNIEDLDGAGPSVTSLPTHASGFHAHGYFKTGAHLFVGPHCMGEALDPCNGTFPHDVYMNSFRIGGPGTAIGGSTLRRAEIGDDTGLLIGSVQRAGSQSPWGLNDFWTYNTIGGDMWLGVRRNGDWIYDWANGGVVTGPGVKAQWDHLGLTGVTGFPFIMGNILIVASDQAGSGVATYDISDVSNPILLDVLKENGPGGYWPAIYGHYLFFPRRDGEGGPGSSAGYMVVDFSDPTDLRIAANRNLEGSNQYVTFQDEYAFMNNYKIDMRAFDVELELTLVPGVIDTSQFALPVGNLLVTGGYGSMGPGLAIWAHQDAPDTRSPYVAYHVPVPDQTNYPTELPITLSIPETLKTETIVDGVSLILRPLGGDPVTTWHAFSEGKLLTVTPEQPLAPDTTYEFILTSDIEDAAGNGLEPFSFRFSTGSGLAGGNQPPVVGELNVSPAFPEPGELVTLSWTGSDPDGDPLEYRVDLGDGSPLSSWSTAPPLDHTYTETGHYQFTVQARDSSGAVAAQSRMVTVIPQPTATGSTASSPLALDESSDRVYTANPDNNSVTAIDTLTHTALWESAVGRHPTSIALGNDGTLWVPCRDTDEIRVLDSLTGSMVATLPLDYGAAPVAVAPSPDGATMYVTLEGDESLVRYSVAARSETGAVALGPWPRAIAVTDDGTRALVTRFISPEHHGIVYDVSLAGGMSLTNEIVLLRDHSSDGPASGRGVPNYLAGIRVTPDGQWAWVVAKKDNVTRGTFFSEDMVPGQDTTVRAMCLLIDLSTGLENMDRRLDLDNSDSPSAIAFSPLGDWAFVALQGNNQIGVIDVLEFMLDATPGGIETRWAVGLAPQGVLAGPESGRLFAKNFMDRSVSVYEAQAFLTTGALGASAVTIGAVGRERLHGEVLRGKQVFYNASDPRMSAEGYISCATCHIDGGHDGRTFDFTNRGEGFRNTIDLRGRSGMGHGNVHWSANFDEIQDFENDIRNFFGGSGFLPDSEFASTSDTLGAAKAGLDEDLDAMAAYVASLGPDSLPRNPHDDGPLDPARGADIFEAQGCATCHVPETGFTDGLIHDVGTLRTSSGQRLGGPLSGIETPTLLGAFASEPYFHDGSAATLDDVFTSTGGRLIQAEDGVLSGTVATDIPWYPMKEWHGSEYVELGSGETIAFQGIDTSAGVGYLEIRYSVQYNDASLDVYVNGAFAQNVFLGRTPNVPSWVPTEWRKLRVPVSYQAGNNDIELRGVSGSALNIDEIFFSTPDDQAAASAHFRNLNATDLQILVRYIQSLDGSAAPQPEVTVTRAGPIPQGGIDAIELPALDTEQVFVYTIGNTGAAPLDLGTFHVDVVPEDEIWVALQPAAQVLPGESTTLEIAARLADATATAVVTGWSSDPGASPVTWTVDAVVPGICPGECLTAEAVGSTIVRRELGDNHTFAIVAGGDAPLTYQWYHEDGTKALTELEFGDGAAYTLYDLDYLDAGEYYCMVSDANETMQGPVFTLLVVEQLPVTGALGMSALALLLAAAGAMRLRRR